MTERRTNIIYMYKYLKISAIDPKWPQCQRHRVRIRLTLSHKTSMSSAPCTWTLRLSSSVTARRLCCRHRSDMDQPSETEFDIMEYTNVYHNETVCAIAKVTQKINPMSFEDTHCTSTMGMLIRSATTTEYLAN